jgi:hypothetical protein
MRSLVHFAAGGREQRRPDWHVARRNAAFTDRPWGLAPAGLTWVSARSLQTLNVRVLDFLGRVVPRGQRSGYQASAFWDQ